MVTMAKTAMILAERHQSDRPFTRGPDQVDQARAVASHDAG